MVQWVGGLDHGLEEWGSVMYCVSCESGFSV